MNLKIVYLLTRRANLPQAVWLLLAAPPSSHSTHEDNSSPLPGLIVLPEQKVQFPDELKYPGAHTTRNNLLLTSKGMDSVLNTLAKL